MVDPISIITLSASVIARCYEYGCKVADAPAEAQELLTAVSNLSAVLVSIQGLWSQMSAELDRLRLTHALEDCGSSLLRIEARLESQVARMGQGKKERLIGRLVWPLRRAETLDIIQLIEQQKSTLTLTLESFTIQKLIEGNQNLKHLSESIEDFNTASKSSATARKDLEILDWLCSYQHQTSHDNACQTHCEDTSSWIIEEPSFSLWRKSRDQLLWLSGLPGSGKTMVTSYVIEHLYKTLKDDGSIVLYFYFDRSTNQTLPVETFLGSLLKQLCAHRGISDQIRELFTSSQRPAGGAKSPDLTQLRAMYQEQASSADTIILVVDGVDEALDPNAVCELIASMLKSRQANTSCFMSSRQSLTTSSLQIDFRLVASIENVGHDISTYIHSRLSSESRLKKMKPEIRQFVQQRLLSKASGMFRLAQCQLDEISKLRTDGAVKEALETLPKTLEASYSRMLDRIDVTDYMFARRVLLWLTHAFYPLSLAAIAEAAVLEPGLSAIEDESRLNDPTDVLDICGTLVFYNDFVDEVRLAHHTVREFLSSAESLSMYLPEKQSHRGLADLCLSYLLLESFTGPFESHEQLISALHKHPLLAYAARNWISHVHEGECEEDLQPLISRLMTSEPTPKFLLWLQIVLWQSTHGFEIPSTGLVQHPTPLYYASSYGLYHTVKSLIDAGADLNVQAGHYGGTAYHAACWRQHPHIVRLLLQAGIDVDVRDNNGMTAFDLIEFTGFDDVAEVALEFYKLPQNYTVQNQLEEAMRALYLQQEQKKDDPSAKYPASVDTSTSGDWHSTLAQFDETTEDTVYELE